MKFLTHHRTEPTAWRWASVVLKGAAACCIAAGFALATDNGGGRSPDNTVSGGDETVGTLPATGRNGIQMPFARSWRGTEPAFYLEGSGSDLATAILGARGRGYVTVEVLDVTTQRMRLAFHGDVTAVFDRDILSTASIDVGIAVPGSFGSGRATMTLGQGAPRGVRVQPGLLHLPVASFSNQGLLDTGALRVHVQGRHPRSTDLSISATPDLLIFRQVD